MDIKLSSVWGKRQEHSSRTLATAEEAVPNGIKESNRWESQWPEGARYFAAANRSNNDWWQASRHIAARVNSQIKLFQLG